MYWNCNWNVFRMYLCHLESPEIESPWYIPGISHIYDHLIHIPGIYLVYTWNIPFFVIYQVYTRYIPEKRIYLEYTLYILSESAISKPGLNLVYTRFMPAHLKSWDPSCSICAIGMQRHTGFGFHGCLMFMGTSRPGLGPGATAVVAAEAWLLFITSSSWHHQERWPGSRRLAASSGGAVIAQAGATGDCVIAVLAATVPLDSTIAGVVAVCCQRRRRRRCRRWRRWRCGTRRPGRRLLQTSACAQHLQPRLSDEDLGAISWFTRVAKQLDEAAPNILVIHDVGLSCVCEFVYIQVKVVEQKHQQNKHNIYLQFSKKNWKRPLALRDAHRLQQEMCSKCMHRAAAK
jgi:hypothetical protein